MSNFLKEFSDYNSTLEKQSPTYSGLLGLGISGSRQVNIPSRPGFVYVRLRDNLSEVIQVYNDKVSPIYDFPVLIQRSGNRWVVIGKDTNRYETWATPAPFLPAHAGQHSFNRDANLGGDTVFVYPDQFMPLLVYPSGTLGAGMLMIAPYVLQRTSDFIYVGNTGTQDLLVYKPTNNQAIMGLVVLNTDTGNPQVLIASGTPLAASITGTASVLPYVPQPASNQEALYAFRLVSGTNAIGWGNLYNARQLVGGGQGGSPSSGINVWDEGVPDGSGITTLDFIGNNVDISVSGTVARVFVTGSSGGSLPTFITGSIPFAGANGQLTENNPLFRWDETIRGLRIGRTQGMSIFNNADLFPLAVASNNPGEAAGIGGLALGTGTSGSPSFTINGYRARGTGTSALLPVQSGDALVSLLGAGYDGASWINGSRIRLYADGNWITGTHTPTRMEFEVTPSGSTTRRTQFQVYGESVNIPTGSTYNVGGVPHTHEGIGGGFASSGRLTLASGTPVISSEQSNKTTLYFSPFRGNKCSFLDGTVLSFAELSLDMSAWTKNCLHDVFRYNNSGTLAIEELSWGTDTAYNISAATAANPVVITLTAAQVSNPFAVNDVVCIQGITGNMGSDVLHTGIWQVTSIGGSNPNWTVTLLGVSTSGKTYTSGGTIRKVKNTRATDIVLDDGVYIKSGDDTRIYLGTVWIDGNGYCQDNLGLSGIWNYYNRVAKSLRQSEPTASWTKATATITPANNKASNRLVMIIGVREDNIRIDLLTSVIPGTTSTYGYAGIGEDRVDTFTGKTMGGGGGATSAWFVFSAFQNKIGDIGIHFFSWNERSTSTNTSTFYGEGTVGGILDSGLEAMLQG